MTNIQKSAQLGWKAESYLQSVNGKTFRITTYKGSRGLQTYAQEGESKKEAGYETFTFAMFQSRHWSMVHGDKATEKAVVKRHEEGIKAFLEAFPEVAELNKVN